MLDYLFSKQEAVELPFTDSEKGGRLGLYHGSQACWFYLFSCRYMIWFFGPCIENFDSFKLYGAIL